MRLIDKDQLLRDLNTGMNIIEMMQTVMDAKEVKPKTGQWIQEGEQINDVFLYRLMCSECGKPSPDGSPLNYCPECGCKMEVEHERSNQQTGGD